MLRPPAEFFTIDIGGGVTLDGLMLKPRSFDPSRKYPVIVHVYGEPAGQTVTDAWGGAGALFHRALADAGYIIVSFDNRGTPAPKGAAWRKVIYGSVGDLSSKEQAAAIRALAAREPYIDSDANRHLGMEWRRFEHAQRDVPVSGRLRGWRGRGTGSGSATVRHHLSGALHGSARGERRGLQDRLADQLR